MDRRKKWRNTSNDSGTPSERQSVRKPVTLTEVKYIVSFGSIY
jgi:hypothetical protein